ncbi:GMC oxidoreductase [Streptomyces sp. ISL-86]|uniref:GMC oxidoreductase n=1 Tax=Streptomyces sp. ISL-86 TaxID=2819187 RepID=UPI001BE5C687|nr:GMC oxidoreductase [Streptomyces sp. ISL-86]MBT2459067.1 NAD(P)-binding protein [Streptomyces sp. ISL-86]
MTEARQYDVVIIGTGAGGGTLAHRLASTGKRILLLERGDYLPRERDNWDSTAVFVKGKYRAPEFWYDKHGNQLPPEVNYYVGGNTKFYGAALFRMCPEDFAELRHHDGVSPAWPLNYDDLEPYYTQAEHLYLVHGRHGEDPTEGPASAQYAYPSVQHEPHIQQLSDDLEKRGLYPFHPFHLPVGVNLVLSISPSTRSKGMPIGATAHQAGTVRFGHDPQSSALDVNCKAHDLDNLYLVDTSFFPSIGAVNPSLTAIANALRVGDHLAERLR